jgi:hypothetical protein
LAAGAGWLRDDLDLAGVALEHDHRLPLRVELFDIERPPVRAARVQVLERLLEFLEVLRSQRWGETEAAGQLVRALDHPRQRSNHDEVDAARCDVRNGTRGTVIDLDIDGRSLVFRTDAGALRRINFPCTRSNTLTTPTPSPTRPRRNR